MKSQQAIRGRWIDDVWNGLNGFVHVETRTGIVRIGRLSGIRTRPIKINGVEQKIPTEIELNGDPTDTLGLDEIVELKLDKKQ